MNHKIVGRCIYAMLLGTTAIGFGMPAYAQQVAQNDQDVQQIEQITVTATRRVERLQDVPISITVFNQQELTDRNVVSAGDLATYTPSLSVNTDFGSNNTSFAIRGFVQDIGTAPAVGVYFADVIEPRGASNGIPTGDGAGPGDFFDLQNVQVLKGPQGTLFGRNTTGGDVLLVPQKPTDEFGGYLEASYGNYDMQRVQGVLNVPVSDDVRLRISGDEMTRDGYLDNVSGIGPSHYNDVDYYALRASLDVDVTSNLENYTIGTYTKSDTNGDVQKMVACDPTNTISPFTLTGGCGQMAHQTGFYDVDISAPAASTLSKTWRVINTTTWTLSDDLTVKNIASYSQYSEYYQNPIFGTNFTFPGAYIGSSQNYPYDFAASTPIPGGLTADEATYSEELQFQGKGLDNRLTWQAGLYLDASDPLATVGSQGGTAISCTNLNLANSQCFDPIGEFLSNVTPGGPYAFGYGNYAFAVGSVSPTEGRTAYRDQAIYAQATYKLTDQWSLTEGLRFTQDAENNTSTQFVYNGFLWPNTGAVGGYVPNTPYPGDFSNTRCTNPAATLPGCTLHQELHSKAPTGLIDLDYRPDADDLIYLKYSRGYRAGVINPNIPAPYNEAQAETVNTYELGAKTSWEGAINGIVDGDIFYNDFENQQLQVGFNANPCQVLIASTCVPASVSPTAAPLNSGKSRIFGLELESTIVPADGWTLHVGYTYLNTDLLSVKTYPAPASGTIANPGPFFAPSGAQKVGDPLELSPRNKVTATAAYTLPVDESLGKIIASATFTHTDPMVTNYSDNTLYQPSVYPGYGQSADGAIFEGMNRVKATDLLNLNLDWKSVAGQPVDLSFFATNVTGQKYLTYIPGLAQGTGFETADVGQPTMYGVRLRYTFGQ